MGEKGMGEKFDFALFLTSLSPQSQEKENCYDHSAWLYCMADEDFDPL
jgi:hypothetical protein